jgi:Pvc16 N-terminal domain
MGSYTAIAEAGQALVQVIWNAIAADPTLVALIDSQDLISLESPAEHADKQDTTLLSIYLYRVVEDGYLKNRGPLEGPGGSLQRPPLTLDLFYLITPLLTDAADRQIVLGKVMQVLYDRPTLEGPDLAGSLAAASDMLRVVLNPVPLSEIALVWQALEIPYMLCVSYVVRVALLQSTDVGGGARITSVDQGFGSRVPGSLGSG